MCQERMWNQQDRGDTLYPVKSSRWNVPGSMVQSGRLPVSLQVVGFGHSRHNRS